MIWNLNQINFKSYGTILPEKEQPFTQINCSSVSLMPEKTFVYRCDEDTWLYSEYGQTILSVSTDGQTFRDFYLDKQVWVRKGVWFALTALHTNASAKIGGSSIPQPLQVRQAALRSAPNCGWTVFIPSSITKRSRASFSPARRTR